jgi:hypothetical protein
MMVSSFAPCCSRQKYTFPDSLKRHLKRHFQDQEAKATAQTDNKSEGNQSCTDSDTEVDNDDTIAVILGIPRQSHHCQLLKK